MRMIGFICGLMLLLVSSGNAGVIKEGTLQARSDGNHVAIQWSTSDESNVKEFVIERRSGTSGEYVRIGSVAPRGNGSYYEFVDESAFKSDPVVQPLNGAIYQYRIRIVNRDNSFTYSQYVSVSHNVSSVRRTWGSLKAMFR